MLDGTQINLVEILNFNIQEKNLYIVQIIKNKKNKKSIYNNFKININIYILQNYI